MRFASLGSGSRGNAALVEFGDGCLMVDCGFSVREACRRLAVLDRVPTDLAAILVTHEHSDHVSGVLPLARRFGIPVLMTAGTARASGVGPDDPVRVITSGACVELAGMEVEAVAVPHDAREPVQYTFTVADLKLGILTDLGSVTPHVVERYRHCQGLLLEANHDCVLLSAGSYPEALKRRVGGDWGHLSNGQTAELLQRLGSDVLRTLVVGHISQQNNSPELVRDALAPVTGHLDCVLYASQDEGFGWQELC
jgi:phosphoribosyl 1,2-cyclic phosphodiesterase